VSGVVCVVCPFAGDEKLKTFMSISVISMRSYPSQHPRSSAPQNHPPLSFFFLPPTPPFLSFSYLFSLLFFFFVLFSFLSFFPVPSLFFFLSLVFLLFLLFVCVCVCVCVCACVNILVCMCVRIWQFHVCWPMLTSSIYDQNSICV